MIRNDRYKKSLAPPLAPNTNNNPGSGGGGEGQLNAAMLTAPGRATRLSWAAGGGKLRTAAGRRVVAGAHRASSAADGRRRARESSTTGARVRPPLQARGCVLYYRRRRSVDPGVFFGTRVRSVLARDLTYAGPVLGAERAGPEVLKPRQHPLIRLLSHVAARGKRHSKERQKL